MDSSQIARASAARWRLPPVLRILVVVALLGIGAVALWTLQGGRVGSSDLLREGAPAPEISLKTADGQVVRLASYRGRPVIVNFWATWCLPCRAEMPAINAVAQAHPDVVVLAVDVLEGPVLVQRYVRDLDLRFAPILDEDGGTASRYHVSLLPSSFFVGSDGTIRAIHVGPMDQPTIEQNLRRAS